MADVVIMALILAAAVLTVVVLFYEPKDKRHRDLPANNNRGEWTITERNIGVGYTGIFVVRQNGGRINHSTSILVGKIRDDAPDWTTRYEELMAQARERLASLQDNK